MAHIKVFTIGHSTQSLDEFLALLARFGIQTLVDVRSRPVSRHAPKFNRRSLEAALPQAGVSYEYMGQVLGGRPDGSVIPEADRPAVFARMAMEPGVQEGIEVLWNLCQESRVAVMCAEEDPLYCHRRLLVGRALLERGLPASDVVHIRRRDAPEAEPDALAREEARDRRTRTRRAP